MNKTGIDYLDYTWNPTHGCEPCSPGCGNCWARAMAKRLAWAGVPGYDVEAPFKPTFHPERLGEPTKLRKPSVIGVSFMGDIFHEDISFEAIDKVMSIISATTHTLPIDVEKSKRWHTYLILTKRPNRMSEYMQSRTIKAGSYEHPLFSVRAEVFRGKGIELMNAAGVIAWPPSNLWLGVTVCTPDEVWKLDVLRQIPAAHRWVSFEPTLADLNEVDLTNIDWCVIGAESGPGARYCDPAWLLALVDKARFYEVKTFVKQIQLHGKLSKDPSEWPEDLRVREVPW